MVRRARGAIRSVRVNTHWRLAMSEYDKYCRQAAAALEAARFVTFLPDKDALIAEAQEYLQQALSAPSEPRVRANRYHDCPVTLGPPFDFHLWP